MTSILENIHATVWGAPTLILILGTGLVLSIATGFSQIRLLPKAISEFFRKLTEKNTSANGIQSFCTALAATVGTGNIAGVAGAIAIGGPGAVFWIWVCGVLGMVIKYAEAVLAVRYRCVGVGGEYIGGPMYIIRLGLGDKFKPLAWLYCLFGLVASFGVGNAAQVNAVSVSARDMLPSSWGVSDGCVNWIVGGVFGVLILATMLGGAKSIGASAEKLVPAAALMYLAMCFGVLICRAEFIPRAIHMILEGALDPKAATGGMVGSVFRCLQTGISRGVFTNEAGMGTAAIAHGGSEVTDPVKQGMLGILEVFIDTILICTLTALVILCSGVSMPYGTDIGAELTVQAFESVYGGWASALLSGGIALFAFAAVLGWGLYGGRCAQYLFGDGVWKTFVVCQSIAAVAGSVLEVDVVWTVSEIFNGLMAVPNLIALVMLLPEVVRLTKRRI